MRYKIIVLTIWCAIFLGTLNFAYAADFEIIKPSEVATSIEKVSPTDWNAVITKINTWLATVAGFSFFIMLLLGAFWYITSEGSEEKAGKAMKTILNAIIGIAIVAVSYGVIGFVINYMYSK